jgi:hypothetical protein
LLRHIVESRTFVPNTEISLKAIFCLQAALKGQRQDCADLTPLQRREKYQHAIRIQIHRCSIPLTFCRDAAALQAKLAAKAAAQSAGGQ